VVVEFWVLGLECLYVVMWRSYACGTYHGVSHKQCICLLLASDDLADWRGCLLVVILPYFMFIRNQPL
jgi:hypothetical protein